MIPNLKQSEVWFVTGSQHLYGPKTLKQVAEDVAAAGEVEVQAKKSDEIDLDQLATESEDAPVIRLVNQMLESALTKRASDIHVEPYEKELRVRYRIDGILYNIMSPPMKMRDAITSRIKPSRPVSGIIIPVTSSA